MDEYYMYLRKSRADRELEESGQGETLARHEKALLSLAKNLNLPVTRIYKEIVSGETIESRPQVQQMLNDIYSPSCKGVLVMEIERLARGNTKDQGVIAEAFKYSDTKIITPSKTYDPNNEFDEEYFEFGLFMSRREYKAINRRIQRGRIASAMEGKFIGGTAPYGYEKVKVTNGKGYTLRIVDEEAKVIRYIYELYVKGMPTDTGREPLGRYRIAKKLDELGIKPRHGESWSVSTIKDILTNPVYAGKIRWGHKKESRHIINGKMHKERFYSDDYLLVDGLHEGIISIELFEEAQQAKGTCHYHIVSNKILKNPLAGLVRCKLCGSVMTRVKNHRNKDIYSLTCPNRNCQNISSPIAQLEESIMEFMKSWVLDYHLNYVQGSVQTKHTSELHMLADSIHSMEAELVQLNRQLLKTYELLEQEIYTNDVFLERNRTLTQTIADMEQKLTTLKDKYQEQQNISHIDKKFIPEAEHLIAFYNALPNAQEKNDMLKSVIDHLEYRKDKPAKKNQLEHAEFHIEVFPKIPSL